MLRALAHLSREAVLLYFFLAAVADKHGLSFYADGTLATLLRMTLAGPDPGPRRVAGPRSDRP